MTEEERQQSLQALRAKAVANAQARRAQSAAAPKPSADPGLGEVASGAVQNFLPSAGRVITDTAAPFMAPVETAKNVLRLAAGVGEKLIPGEQRHEPIADAVGAHFADRYGSAAGFKRAVRDDPAGVMADLSVPLSAGGSVAARAPGIVGKVGRAAQIAGGIEPVNAVVQTARGAAKYVPHVVGAHTGVGQTPLHVAYEAGKAGGTRADQLATNMREGGSPAAMLEVVDDARKGMSKAYAERGAQYRSDMSAIDNVAGPVNPNVFQSIGKAAGKSLNMHRFNGIDFSPKTLPVRKEIYDTVVKWGNRDPQTFHTPAGLDKMKREIGDIRDSYDVKTPEFKAANDVYKAIDAEIDKLFPDYAVAMHAYSENSKKLDNLSRTLSLGGKATDDTALRKLQSSMRDNVNTSYGGRMSLIDDLSRHVPGLKERLAGQALSSPIPRGLSKHFGVGQLGTAATLAMHNPLLGAPLALTALFSSPRLMGEAALLSGRAVGGVSRATPQAVKDIAPHLVRRPMLHGSRALGMLSNEIDELEGTSQ